MCALLPTRDQIAGWFADRQHGVVSREQLLAGGWTPRMVAHAIKTGRLRPVYRGVYAVGHTALRRHGWWQAALLTCGDGSALAARSAGMIWGLGTWPVLPVRSSFKTTAAATKNGCTPTAPTSDSARR